MELYKISPDDEQWGKKYNDDLVAKYPWGLPGVHCPVCNQKWATIGVSYPLVNLSGTPLGKQLEKAKNVELEVFETLRDTIKPYVPAGLPLPPGTDFGTVKGKVKGKFGDFIWRHLWDPLMRVEAYQKLVSAGLHLPVTAIPFLQEKVQGQVFQLQIEPHGCLSPRSYIDPDTPICPRCKRDGRKFAKIVMIKESIPNHLSMFRIGDFPTMVLVSQDFKEAVEQFGFTNIIFEKVEIDNKTFDSTKIKAESSY
jgi:uncharacterized double-CXXCG motif protein